MAYPSSPTASLSRAARDGVPVRPPAPVKPQPTPYDFAQTARANNLSGSFVDPATGARYSTAGGGGGGDASQGGMGGGFDMSALTNAMHAGAPAAAAQEPAVPQVAPVDTTAAHAAAFARAKDTVGKTASGALASLRAHLGGSNMLGSGAEGRQTASVINAGQAQLGEVSREAAIDDAKRADDTAKFNYGGAVTQRGQNMSDAATRRSQALTEVGQRNQQALAMASLMRASRRPVTY